MGGPCAGGQVELDNILVLYKVSTVALDPALLSAIASPRRQAIVSLQLRALQKAGLVSVRPEGRHRYYRIERERLGPVGALLEQMWADALWRLKVQAEFESTRRGPRPRRPIANRRHAGLPDSETH